MLALCLSLLVQTEPVVVPFGDAADTTVVEVPFSVSEVRDSRRMASLDPSGIGVTTIGVFEERAPLRTPRSVAQEVEAYCRKRLRPSAGALPVRLEILSLETWSKPVDGPDPFHALARVRVVSIDSSRPGVVLVPEARSERKGVTTAAHQSAMLASSLRDALTMVRADMQPVPGAASLASQPELQKKTSSIPASAVSLSANCSCCGMRYRLDVCNSRPACAAMAATSSGWLCPRVDTAIPDRASR